MIPFLSRFFVLGAMLLVQVHFKVDGQSAHSPSQTILNSPSAAVHRAGGTCDGTAFNTFPVCASGATFDGTFKTASGQTFSANGNCRAVTPGTHSIE